MRRLSAFLAISGILACVLGMGVLLTPTQSAIAQSLPDRPTLTPTPAPAEEDDATTPAATGRITGTVIDTRTGAPTAGVSVQVGDLTVTTDANGNYDRNGLLPATYAVTLQITADHGVAEQGTLQVNLSEGATVVQHLMFHSSAPIVATPAPTPVALPSTGGTEPGSLLLVAGLGMLLAAGLIRQRV